MREFIILSTVSATFLTIVLLVAVRLAHKAETSPAVYVMLVMLLGLQAGLAGTGMILITVGAQLCGW